MYIPLINKAYSILDKTVTIFNKIEPSKLMHTIYENEYVSM